MLLLLFVLFNGFTPLAFGYPFTISDRFSSCPSLPLTDANTGTLSLSISPGIDQIQPALDYVAQCATVSSGKYVYLEPGIHYISIPLIINTSHSSIHLSGSTDSNQPSIIDGGVPLPFFTTFPNGTWLTSLPPSNFTPASSFPTLFSINGVRRTRARNPNALDTNNLFHQYTDNYTYHIQDPLQKCTAPAWGSCPAEDKYGFIYNLNESSKYPPLNISADLSTAWILIFASWTAEWIKLGTFVPDNSSLMFQEPANTAVGTYGVTPQNTPGGGRYVLENSLDFLDAPGEWYASSINVGGQVYYQPYPDEDITTTVATMSALPSLLNIQGNNASDPIINFTLSNIEVRNWGEWSENARKGADPAIFGAIIIDNADSLLIQNITIHSGVTNGIQYNNNVRNLILDHLTVYDVGGSGIGALYNNNENATNIMISNSTVYNVGNVYVVQPSGIALGGKNVSCLHNQIYNVGYSGIIGAQIGGSEPTGNNNNDYHHHPTNSSSSFIVPPVDPIYTIAYNNISNYGLGILNDFGGIYIAVYGDCWLSNTCWLTSYIHHNFITQGTAYNYGANGIYTDQALSGAYVSQNILAKIGAVAHEAHCGYNNTAINNIWYIPQVQNIGSRNGAFGGCNALGFPPGLNSTFALYTNIIYLNSTSYVTSGEFSSPDNDYFSPFSWFSNNNLFYTPNVSTTAKYPLHYPNNTVGLSAWQKAWGQDINSLEINPYLSDPEQNNFTVMSNSSIWDLGWIMIDISTIGPLN